MLPGPSGAAKLPRLSRQGIATAAERRRLAAETRLRHRRPAAPARAPRRQCPRPPAPPPARRAPRPGRASARGEVPRAAVGGEPHAQHRGRPSRRLPSRLPRTLKYPDLLAGVGAGGPGCDQPRRRAQEPCARSLVIPGKPHGRAHPPRPRCISIMPHGAPPWRQARAAPPAEPRSFPRPVRRQRRSLHPVDPAAAEVVGHRHGADVGEPAVLLLPTRPVPAAAAETRMGEQRFGDQLDDQAGEVVALGARNWRTAARKGSGCSTWGRWEAPSITANSAHGNSSWMRSWCAGAT